MQTMNTEYGVQLATYGLLGGNGSYRLTSTDALSRTFKVILVLEDAIIAALTESGVTDALASHNISAVTLAAGEVIVARSNFTAITLTSGKVALY